jgi:Ca-activated chloride channel homolog
MDGGSRRKSRRRPIPSCLLLSFLLAFPALPQTQEVPLKTPVGTYTVEATAEYLGMVREKTIVRIRIQTFDLAQALYGKGFRRYEAELVGDVGKPDGTPVEAFRYPMSGALLPNQPIHFSFLRALAPGSYHIALSVGDTGKRVEARTAIDIDVPELSVAFRPEMASGEIATLPSAEAVVLAAPPEPEGVGPGLAAEAASEPRVRILPPDRDTPIGLLRLTAEVKPPVEKVEFYLDDQLLVSRNRPPYTVEVDLGKIPRKQTVRAVGYDAGGRLIDEDAWAINEGDSRVAVRVLTIPSGDSSGGVRVKVAVQSINGGQAQTVELFADARKLASWTRGPYEVVVPAAVYSKATYLRATATTSDGKEANDIKFIHGPTAAVENVRVDVVNLHISALDKSGHFVQGLKASDFVVKEDGAVQTPISFEVAEHLSLTLGMVIDGSGSMQKAMPFVHSAGVELFRSIIGERDRGFVIEFREAPRLLAAPTSDVNALTRAVEDTRALGQTAVWDSIVLGLYQFRGLPGRKALVVVSDGGDNHSWVDYDTMLRYARGVSVPVYVIAVNIPITEFTTRRKLSELANETGGEIFHTSNPAKIGEIARTIEVELRSQYVLSYKSTSSKPPEELRRVDVEVKRPGVRARTIRAYIP